MTQTLRDTFGTPITAKEFLLRTRRKRRPVPIRLTDEEVEAAIKSITRPKSK